MKTLNELEIGDEIYYLFFEDEFDFEFFEVKSFNIASLTQIGENIKIMADNGYIFLIPKSEENKHSFKKISEDYPYEQITHLLYDKEALVNKLQKVKEEIIEDNMFRLKQINKRIKKYQ